MSNYDKNRPFIPPTQRKQTPGSRNPPPQREPPIRRGGFARYDNGSTLCATFLVKGSCPNNECPWDHRKPRPGERVPLCAIELNRGKCHKTICPLDHDIEKAYELPGNRPPKAPPTLRGSSDPEALLRMEQQARNSNGPAPPPPRASEGGSTVRRVREARPPMAGKEVTAKEAIPDTTQPSSNVVRKADKFSKKVLPAKDDDQSLSKPAPLVPKNEDRKSEKMDRKKHVGHNGNESRMPPPPPVAPKTAIEKSAPPSSTSPSKAVPKIVHEEPNLLLDEEVDAKRSDANSSTRPISSMHRPSNDDTEDLLGGDEAGPGWMMMQETPIHTKVSESELFQLSAMGIAFSKSTTTIDNESPPTVILPSEPLQHESVDKIEPVAFDGPSAYELKRKSNVEMLPDYDHIGVLGSGDGTEFGMLPPGIRNRGVRNHQARIRIPEIPMSLAYYTAAIDGERPLHLSLTVGGSVVDGEEPNEASARNKVYLAEAFQPTSKLSDNSSVGMLNTKAENQKGRQATVNLRNFDGQEKCVESGSVSVTKGRGIMPQDLVAQVVHSTRATLPSTTFKPPANKGNILPQISPPTFQDTQHQNTYPTFVRQQASQSLNHPILPSRPINSRIAHLQNKTLNLLDQLQGAAEPTTKATTLPSSNRTMAQTTLLPQPTRNLSMMSDSDASSKSGGVPLYPQERFSTTSSDAPNLLASSRSSSVARLSTTAGDTEGYEYEWEEMPNEASIRKLPTCAACHDRGHPTVNCPQKRPMPLAFLKAEAVQDGITGDLLEGNFPAYRRELENPIDKVFREMRSGKASSSIVSPTRSPAGVSWLQNSSSQLMDSPTQQKLATPSEHSPHFANQASSSNIDRHSTSRGSPSATNTLPSRPSAVEQLRSTLDASPYCDAKAKEIPSTVPYEYQSIAIDNCLKAFQEDQEERLRRCTNALTLVEKEGYRGCGVPMVIESPKEYIHHKRGRNITEKIIEPETGWTSTIIERHAKSAPVVPKIFTNTQSNPPRYTPASTISPSPITPSPPSVALSQEEAARLHSLKFVEEARRSSNDDTSRDAPPQKTEHRSSCTPADLRELDEKSQGYVIQPKVCFNCWKVDHIFRDCQQPVLTFSQRETLRQSKKIWSYSWAQLLYRKQSDYLLFVPTQFKEQWAKWVADEQQRTQTFYNQRMFGVEKPVGAFADTTDRKEDATLSSVASSCGAAKHSPSTSSFAVSPVTPTRPSFPTAKPSPYSHVLDALAQTPLAPAPLSPPESPVVDQSGSSNSTVSRGQSEFSVLSNFEVTPAVVHKDDGKVVAFRGNGRSEGNDYKGGPVRLWNTACWNCWSSSLHSVKECREPRRPDHEREMLRREKMVYSRPWTQYMQYSKRGNEVLPTAAMHAWYRAHHSEPLSVHQVPESGRSSSVASNDRPASPQTPVSQYDEPSSSKSTLVTCWFCHGVHERYQCPKNIPGLRTGAPEPDTSVLQWKGKGKESSISDGELLKLGSPRSSSRSPVGSPVGSPKLASSSSVSDVDSDDEDEKLEKEEKVRELRESLYAVRLASVAEKKTRRRKHDDPFDHYPHEDQWKQQRGGSRKIHGPRRKSAIQETITGRSRFAELPAEILDNIFEYVWYIGLRDEYLGESNADQAMAKRIQCREYRGVLCLNRRCCAIAQRLIYSNVTIVDRYQMFRFMKTVVDERSPQLREYVQHINFAIEPVSNSQGLFRFKNNRCLHDPLDEITARSFHGPPRQDETVSYNKSLRIATFLLKNCPNLQTLVAQFRGALASFNRIKDGQFPNLRELTVADRDCAAACLKGLWKNVLGCPNLEKLAIEYSRDNRQADHSQYAIRASLASYKNEYYPNIKSLSFKFAPEISDEWLVIFAGRMPKLEKIYIEDCKNVSSDGVARCIKNLSRPLLELTFIPYMDWSGRVLQDEANSGKTAHFCEALGIHSETLEVVKISPYRVCSALFEDRRWENIKSFEIDMFEYRGCLAADGSEASMRNVQESMTTTMVPTRALGNFRVGITGSAVARTRRPGDADLPPLPNNPYQLIQQ
ncbi:hypothetical protein BJ508DRAFT_419698 [Ascobolus immersus RN42]|uniref:C3H1-type domain-containing protein n=1 Tax=Ascobolus immersus RN42 TaxID=1160509 RepID=A0A3N4HIC4_ASCIM|nr:hypothetical protein BJ508DRAFT_419698 [Ascobolus immersus RN42]